MRNRQYTGLIQFSNEIRVRYTGFRIIQAIIRKETKVKRIVMRDTMSSCGILLDDNNRKPTSRLWFNRTQKYSGLFLSNKDEKKIPINNAKNLYHYADRIIESVTMYDTGS
jgi:hypothetical protein